MPGGLGRPPPAELPVPTSIPRRSVGTFPNLPQFRQVGNSPTFMNELRPKAQVGPGPLVTTFFGKTGIISRTGLYDTTKDFAPNKFPL